MGERSEGNLKDDSDQSLISSHFLTNKILMHRLYIPNLFLFLLFWLLSISGNAQGLLLALCSGTRDHSCWV